MDQGLHFEDLDPDKESSLDSLCQGILGLDPTQKQIAYPTPHTDQLLQWCNNLRYRGLLFDPQLKG